MGTDVHYSEIERIWNQSMSLEKKVVACLAYIYNTPMAIADKAAVFLKLTNLFAINIHASEISDREKERRLIEIVSKTFSNEFSQIKGIWGANSSLSDTQKITQSLGIIQRVRVPQGMNQTEKNREQSICLLFMLVYLYSMQGGTESKRVVAQGFGSGTEGDAREFVARAVIMRDISASVTIKPYNGKIIRIEAEPRSILNGLNISNHGDQLRIEGKNSGRGRGNISIRTNGSSINISNGSIIIDGVNISGDGCEDIRLHKLSISVPVGTSVDVADISGDVSIGDTYGILQACAEGSNSITVGRVKSAALVVSGTGSIQAEEVTGSLMTEVSGMGHIIVKGGKVTSLNVSVSGTGQVQIGGQSETAMLSVSGMGNIYVARVETRPMKSVSGMGHITVGNWN